MGYRDVVAQRAREVFKHSFAKLKGRTKALHEGTLQSMDTRINRGDPSRYSLQYQFDYAPA